MVRRESFTQTGQEVDVLLVIDPSGSMLDEKPRLLAAIARLTQNIIDKNADFHLGVISLAPDEGGVIALGQLLGTPSYLDSGALGVNPVAYIEQQIKERMELSQWSPYEHGIDALIAAFSTALSGQVAPTCASCAAPNVCAGGVCHGPNHGFRRPGAALEILFFSDEDDGSEATPQEGINSLALLEGQGSAVRVHGLLPQSCAGGETYPRWSALVTATGGAVHDLCASDYSPAIDALTEQVFGPQSSFKLAEPPMEGTTKVTVDGQPVGFNVSGGVTIQLVTAPAVGATISVTYCIKQI